MKLNGSILFSLFSFPGYKKNVFIKLKRIMYCMLITLEKMVC